MSLSVLALTHTPHHPNSHAPLHICFENSHQKWGDTEIAERGRSVLVMRARYRSAGLTPHQRGWTDAG